MTKILIVDDSVTGMFAMTTILKKNRFDIISAISGEEGIALAETERPDLILMDIVMPGIDGFQATRKLNQNPSTQSIPIVIVSSKSQETDRFWAIKQGAIDYLIKPIVEKSLLAKINLILQP